MPSVPMAASQHLGNALVPAGHPLSCTWLVPGDQRKPPPHVRLPASARSVLAIARCRMLAEAPAYSIGAPSGVSFEANEPSLNGSYWVPLGPVTFSCTSLDEGLLAAPLPLWSQLLLQKQHIRCLVSHTSLTVVLLIFLHLSTL